jgi:TRAP-type C4-dicarboxylate transport system permease small subunit
MERLSEAFGRVLAGLALLASLLLFAMTLMICADVLLRNVPLVPGLRGLAWSNEVSEGMLYLITLLTAPWLLRRGQHIRVDILLRAIPGPAAWICEWVSDIAAFCCCAIIAVYAWRSAAASYASGSLSIKTLVTPEWWLLGALPLAFGLLAIELLFRMRRLYRSERAARDDAVSAG